MFKVKFMKYFTKGIGKGTTFDSVVSFATLDAATEYMGFLIAHSETPVNAIGGGDYTCHVIRMERE